MKLENFVINLYKPVGFSSTQAGNHLKKYWNCKKIGHLGTLDPMAEGILPIFGGQYTKLIPYFQDRYAKFYRLVFHHSLLSNGGLGERIIKKGAKKRMVNYLSG